MDRLRVLNTLFVFLALLSTFAAAIESRKLASEKNGVPTTQQYNINGNVCSTICNDKQSTAKSCTGTTEVSCVGSIELEGAVMETALNITCHGSYVNSTTRADNIVKNSFTCEGVMNNTVIVSTIADEGTTYFLFDYGCFGAFSSITGQEYNEDGSKGINFFQNAICNGTERSTLKYSYDGNPLDDLVVGDNYKFLRIEFGSCTQSADLLSSIDILGLFYSYEIVPGCHPEPSRGQTRLFERSMLPVNLLCEGKQHNLLERCNGLLIGLNVIPTQSISLKCRGKWRPETSLGYYNCTGELFGEQEKIGARGSYVRSSTCAGENIFIPLYEDEDPERIMAGTLDICTGAAIKSTIFGPNEWLEV